MKSMTQHSGRSIPLYGLRGTIAAILAIAALSGCHKQPGGQVVAVVNDEEITMQELNTEAQAAQLTGNGEQKVAPADLLQRVITRNLLADYAREEGLDRGPDYIARRRQLEQSLLADVAARKLAGTRANPTPAEIDAFIAEHPYAFAERERLVLDQVRFATPAQPAVLKEITDMPTLEGVVAQLEAKNIAFKRGSAVLDTASIGTAPARQILSLKPGEAFSLSVNGETYVSVVKDRKGAALDRAEWPGYAANALRTTRMTTAMTDAVKRLRDKANIKYEPSFQPAK
ncbi:MAG: hypothetical protein QM676_00435 [Novosphingobium sp.]